MHTRRSDGTGTTAEVAAAAARAGLQFVIITDHGDATRKPDRPAYMGNVLVIDGVEISTAAGHLVALGLGQAPYPLGGEPRDVVEDVHRLGGFAIAAHPHSPRGALQWTDWDADIDGVEWLNADTEWRDENLFTLARTLLTYPVRPVESVASLFERPVESLQRWDELTRTRFVVGLAAPDAHARVGLRSLGEPYDRTASLRLPSYETMFRTVSIGLDGMSLTGDAADDAAGVLAAIRAGRLFSAVDAVATPATLSLRAASGRYTARAGEMLPLDGPVTLSLETNAPPEAQVTWFRDGAAVRSAPGQQVPGTQPAEPAVYRVEIALPGAAGAPPVPWIVSNPIYVVRPGVARGDAALRADAKTFAPIFENDATAPGHVEHSATADSALDVVRDALGRQLLFRYAVGGRMSESPYAATAFPVTGVAKSDRVMFTARAAHPMRLGVQLRVSESGQRWQRSVYLDEMPRTVTVFFDQMKPVGDASSAVPPLDRVDSLLLVVDTLNTALGTNGQVWIDEMKLAK